MNRRSFLRSALASAALGTAVRGQAKPPNIVLILADDLGYGDLGCYGSDIPTPNLDAMASRGVRFDHFYSTSPVCSPSRAALLTGRYQTRVQVPRVLMPGDAKGLSLSEMTLPQVLKKRGYATACIGKWHLGSQPDYIPTRRGFDQFFGVPYSNDMWPLPLMSNADVLEPQCRLDLLTRRYTDKAISFIVNSGGSPFFLYLAHTFPHVPLAVSTRFKGQSKRGLYGDCVMELDWSVGRILTTLKEYGLEDNTLVMFTSDNGPWFQGSTGELRGRKGSTYEGGMREPFIARWPGRIPAGGRVESLATTMDILPTVARIAGANPPGTPLDGVDIFPLMTGEKESVDRDVFLYFDGWNVQCARDGRWKLHVARYNTAPWEPEPVGGRVNLQLSQPELYDMIDDPGESYDLAADNPDIVASIRARMETALRTFPPEVQTAWNDMKNQPAGSNYPGGLPTRP